MSDRVLRARFDAEAAENTAAIINVIDLCIPLVAANTFRVGTSVILGFNVDTFRRACSSTKVACNAFFFSVLVNAAGADLGNAAER